jgi:zinc D-Ala-D-Ala dipeptidase
VDRRTLLEGGAAALAFAIAGCRDSPAPVQKAKAKAGAPVPTPDAYVYRGTNLVELLKINSGFALDIRYATTNNFVGKQLYPGPRAFLVKDAAEALNRAEYAAAADGYGLTIYDAYRPLSVTRAMWAATPRHLRNYVANPAKGSKHNRGAAIDLTLHDRNSRKPVVMPSDFDDFSKRAHRDFMDAPAEALANRARLERYMVAAGFRPMSNEWWHFDFIGWKNYPILDVPFTALAPLD